MTTFLDLVRVYSTAPTNAPFLEHLESQEGGGGVSGPITVINPVQTLDINLEWHDSCNMILESTQLEMELEDVEDTYIQNR